MRFLPITALATLFLTACAGSGGSNNAGAGTTIPIGPASAQSIYVNQRPTSTTDAVGVYGPTGAGNPQLERSITTQSGIHMNTLNIAVDSAGFIYAGLAAFAVPCQLQVFAPGATGVAQPLQTIANCGPIAIDSSNNVYLPGTPANGQTRIDVYPPIHSAAVPAPIRSFSFAGTSALVGIATDLNANVYVALAGDVSGLGSAVEVFAAGASGLTVPFRTIAGSRTGFQQLTAVAVDQSGRVYVSSQGTSSATTALFAAGASGDVSPVNSIPIGAQQLAVDSLGDVYLGGPIYGATAQVDIYSPGLTALIGTVPLPTTPSALGASGVAIGP